MPNSYITNDLGSTVSTDWVWERLGDRRLKIIDATWHMPEWNRDAAAEHAAGHIPGAVFVDIDAISDPDSALPQMAPGPGDFARRMGALGISDADGVVVYDSHGIYSAARIWWTFRLMGKRDVAVLDGGLPKWLAEGRPIEDTPPAPTAVRMTAVRRPDLVKVASDVRSAVDEGSAQIVDTRSPEEVTGEIAGPWQGLRAGRIPTSRNVPYHDLLNDDETLKSPDELSEILAEAGIDPFRPVIATCLVGLSAAILALALERIGHRSWSLYDGSWSEWGADKTYPLENGPI